MVSRARKQIRALFRKATRRFYVLSGDELRYREVRYFRTKVLLSSFSLAATFIICLLAINHFSDDVLGLGYNQMSMLRTENQVLKEQIASLSGQMEAIEGTLETIADRGNALRLMVDLPPLDKDTRSAAVGGSKEFSDLAYVSGEVNHLLQHSREMAERLAREVQLQKASNQEVYNKYVRNQDFFAHLPSVKPIPGDYSIQGFGMRVHPVLGIWKMHEGVDIVADVGTPVYAAANGTVRYAGRTSGGYGTVIEVAHGYGYSTLYAHLSKVLVHPGEKVERGELIGRSGRTGLVSGPHLHYEVKYHGRKVNPVDFFFDDVDPGTYRMQLASAGRP